MSACSCQQDESYVKSKPVSSQAKPAGVLVRPLIRYSKPVTTLQMIKASELINIHIWSK